MQETETKVEFEAELRQQLARQAAAHSDHLVSVLHAQRVKLEAEFEQQLIDSVQAAKEKMMNEIGPLVDRVKAVESAVDGQPYSVFYLLFHFWCSYCHSISGVNFDYV